MSGGPVLATATFYAWYRVIPALVGLLLFVGPMIAMCLAWDAREKRPATARKCARIAMIGSAVAVVLFLGIPLCLAERPSTRIRYLVEAGTPIGIFQATVYALAWLAAREPRRVERDRE